MFLNAYFMAWFINTDGYALQDHFKSDEVLLVGKT
jgi:hypothetical protein